MNKLNLKPGWRKVKFGDVVRLSKARSQDPLADGYARYIGLEHLEPGDLRVRSWGNVADGTTFTSVFKPGQVLFGKRRAYQRKVAVADFSGVCSGDIYVLESRDAEVLLPDLLPFICQTDAFFEHAVGTSAGSLSPRTNWTSLADFEFALPPLDEQRKIIERVQAIDGLAEQLRNALHAGRQLVGASLAEMTARMKCIDTTLAQISEFITDGDHNPPKRQPNGIPHLVVANITEEDGYNFDGCTFISEADFERVKKRYTPKTDDIIITCVGSIGRVAIVDGRTEFSADRSLAIVRPCQDKLIPEYGFFLMKSPQIQRQFAHSSIGTAQAHLYLKELRAVKIQLPSIREQENQLAVLREISVSISALGRRLSDIVSLRKVVITAI